MYWLYSPENFPHEGYQQGRNREYISACGVQIAPVKAAEWQQLKTGYVTIQFEDYQDKVGKQVVIVDHEIARHINEKFGNRGVLVVSDGDYQTKKDLLEEAAQKVNIDFRKRVVEEFEQTREEVKAQGRTYRPSGYIEECYDILQLPKPWSADTLMKQRDPGAAAAQQIADAIATALPAAIQTALLEIQTRPSPKEVPANG
jgi:hypothetical protein